jgi:hypothetical protein
MSLADEMGVKIFVVGKTTQKGFRLNNLRRDIEDLKDVYFNRFQEIIEQDL